MSEEKGLIVFKHGAIEITQEQKQTFIGFVSQQNPTEAELLLHFDFCARKGVHPLERLIYFTKRQGKYTPITSIDYMRMRAESSGAYAGSDDAVFKGTSKINNKDYPQSATVTVWKLVEGQRCPFTATARWQEYAPGDLSENASFMWRTKPYVMLAKCAEALALRKAFPGQLQGLYTSEEFDRDTSHEPVVVKTHAPNESQETPDSVIDGEVVAHTEEAKQPKKEVVPASKLLTVNPAPEKSVRPMITIWDGKTQRDPLAIISPHASQWIRDTFKGKSPLDVPAHLTNHLKDHFGVAKIADLNYEQATAFVMHLKGEGDDPNFYDVATLKPVEVHDHETSSGYSDDYLNGVVSEWAKTDKRVKVSTYAELPNELKADLMTLLTDHVGEGKTIVDPNDLKTIIGYLEMG